MNLLAIDTSTVAQVLGLRCGTETLTRFELVGREHSQRVLPDVMGLLEEAGVDKSDLHCIVFGRGPGSFTGLRIAVGVTQGLAFGLGIPVAPVSTLACLAQGAYRELGAREIVVALTARKREVFFGSYRIEGGLAEPEGSEGVFEADRVPRQAFDRCVGLGGGWTFQADLEAALGASAHTVMLDVYPRAEDLLALGAAMFDRGETVSALEAEPEYLREKVAARPGERLA